MIKGAELVDQTGKKGKLICNDKQGLSLIDIFSEILNTETDLRRFLQMNNCQSIAPTLPGLIIQGEIFLRIIFSIKKNFQRT